MVIGTQQKNRRHLPRCLLQKIIHSDFLRRHYPHQVKGSKFRYFLSACFTSSPVFDCDCILHPLRTNCKRGQRRAQRCKTFFTQVLGRFTQVLLKKKVKYGIFKVDAARILFWSAPMIQRMDGGLGLTITDMSNVTTTGSNAKGSLLGPRGTPQAGPNPQAHPPLRM